MVSPKNVKRHKYQFADDIKFFQKAIVIHPTDNKFIIIKRSKTDPVRPGTWDLPGGNTLYGELHTDALKREILEETGMQVKNIKVVHVVTYFEKEKPMYYLVIGFLCTATSDKLKLSDEHSEFRWTTKDKFLALDKNYSYREDRQFDPYSTDSLRDMVFLAFSK